MYIIDNLKEYIKVNKIKVLIALFILLFAVIIIIINNNKDENKVYDNRNYIYTSETKDIGGIESKLPSINLYGEDIEDINKEIMTEYYTINLIGEKYMTYEYYKNSNILSLIVKIYYLESNDFVPENIDFYNIDINSGKLLTDDQLFDMYNLSKSEIENRLLERIEEYYNYEIKNDYVTSCDFNCYKGVLGNNILENAGYYVKDNSIFVYKYFPIDRNFAYDDNKPFELFRFKIN